jgi:hypothetical protein
MLSLAASTPDAPLYASAHPAKMPHDSLPDGMPGISKLMQFNTDLYSGARPQRIGGTQSLYEFGVRTIISVDSTPPYQHSADLPGISLIHIPLTYSGPDEQQILDLTTAYVMARGNGKVYIHCHHGMHRAPTACALISIAIGISTPEQTQVKMEAIGTSRQYPMLWESVDVQTPIHMLDVVSNMKSLPRAVTASDIASAMTMIDEALTQLAQIKNHGWSIPANHPDLAPAASAGFISETLRNLHSITQWRKFGLELIDAKAAVNAAATLEKSLLLEPRNAEVLDMQFDLVRQSCTLCHAKLRNFRCSAGSPEWWQGDANHDSATGIDDFMDLIASRDSVCP